MGISVIAALAVLPVAANAAGGDQVAKLNASAVVSSQNLATTSYVQGAYKAAADKIDAVIDSTSIATDGNYIDAGKDVAHNLGELDTAAKNNADAISTETTARQNADTAINNNIGTLSNLTTTEKSNLVAAINEVKANSADAYQLKVDSNVADKDAQDNTITYNYISSGTGVAANLVALDTQAKTNATAISNEATARAQADTAIENTIGSEAMGTSATTVKGAIAEIDGKVDTLTADENTSGSLAYEAKARADADTAINDNIGTMSNLATTADTLVGAINEVNTAVSTLNTNAAATYQTLENSNVAANGNHITAGQGVGNNLVALDDAVEVIENKQIPIVADWSTGTVTQKKISDLVTAQ